MNFKNDCLPLIFFQVIFKLAIESPNLGVGMNTTAVLNDCNSRVMLPQTNIATAYVSRKD